MDATNELHASVQLACELLVRYELPGSGQQHHSASSRHPLSGTSDSAYVNCQAVWMPYDCKSDDAAAIDCDATAPNELKGRNIDGVDHCDTSNCLVIVCEESLRQCCRVTQGVVTEAQLAIDSLDWKLQRNYGVTIGKKMTDAQHLSFDFASPYAPGMLLISLSRQVDRKDGAGPPHGRE
eukprot:SAG31_NODE_344_length_17385_cov_58.217575_12_plen_180_part_00